MKQLQVTNLTMNPNLSVYLGAYTDKIFRLAILNSNALQTILSIIPYLKQMRISYKIYPDEETFVRDTNSKINIPHLKRLDAYSTIHVEWQPEIS